MNDLPDKAISNEVQNIIRNNDSYVLYKSVEKENYTAELFEQGVFTSEIISLNLRGTIGVEILAASDYCTWSVPNILNYGIRQRLEVTDLTNINENIKEFTKRTPEEKVCIEVALMYLNKSKICIKRVNGNYEHAIFFRVALENCFNAPKEKKEAVIAQRATVLLNQFESSKVKQKFKRIYAQTSVAVHSGKVPKAPRNNSKERKVKIGDYYMYDILVMSISKIINNGFPNW
ncbi:hypothetical protein PQO03_19230 [Lentisphaera profundi]|uniref:Apea-like HEPN domain-containing protein n=1 Tax=Lentisphaera profundi TaxID=1658616 RepID=A0ABY7W111_9BACT|nr:hypothetical protein [Lentisphaera profundi]WDE97963.1 hypothetical protein PQO03_19230 [Lentisphaera profundi]